jgi:hypothetical protein
MKQPVNAVEHVLVFYKLAPAGLLNASLHSSDETGLIFEHPGNSVLHKLLGVLAVGRGQLLEPRFNVGCEMDFHEAQNTANPRVWQGWPPQRNSIAVTARASLPGASALAGAGDEDLFNLRWTQLACGA